MDILLPPWLFWYDGNVLVVWCKKEFPHNTHAVRKSMVESNKERSSFSPFQISLTIYWFIEKVNNDAVPQRVFFVKGTVLMLWGECHQLVSALRLRKLLRIHMVLFSASKQEKFNEYIIISHINVESFVCLSVSPQESSFFNSLSKAGTSVDKLCCQHFSSNFQWYYIFKFHHWWDRCWSAKVVCEECIQSNNKITQSLWGNIKK